MSTISADRSNQMSAPDPQTSHSSTPADPSAPKEKAKVIGLYGVPGVGKTTLLKQLQFHLTEKNFTFYEGSEIIAGLAGSLDAFKNFTEDEKIIYRERAITRIATDCTDSGKTAVVTGHFMFWPEDEKSGKAVCTPQDLMIFTHILYLDVSPEAVVQHRATDKARARELGTVEHVRRWQLEEKSQLRHLCHENEILFTLLYGKSVSLAETLNAVDLLKNFRAHSVTYNQACAETELDQILDTMHSTLETMLVIDGDKTLTAVDTGEQFWEKASEAQLQPSSNNKSPLKTLFGSKLAYSYTAFRQAALLCEETANEQEYDAMCEQVASDVSMHPEFTNLLQMVAEKEHVGAVVITCGLRRIWEKVLEKACLLKTVRVIGGGRLVDGYVVSPQVKGDLVARLRGHHRLRVLAFGDSQLDLPMLKLANQAIVVVGEEQNRSKSMDSFLEAAIDKDGLKAHQVLLPSVSSPRLDTKKLPLVQLWGKDFTEPLMKPRMKIIHATDKNAARLLMTPTRDARIAGPDLREAHRRIGYYLATEFLTDVIGIEECSIPHVQGHPTQGHRLRDEQRTSIVPLMRGGEPMAFGVSEAFPRAIFVHAKSPEDLTAELLQDQSTVVLVDSVVNTGNSIVEFVDHIRKLCPSIRIVVLAGVVQAKSVRPGGAVRHLFNGSNFSVVALRLSDNSFKGKGTTDTGARLFNTTRLE